MDGEEEEEEEEEGEEERQDEEYEEKGYGGIWGDYTAPFSQIHCLKKSGYRPMKPLIEMRGHI